MAEPRDIVLIVDDSPEALGFLTDALEQTGFSVLIATSGQASINIAGKITPDIILMDAVMPAMDGFETCRRLKADAAIAPVPVIFMTGLTETEHVVHALESGGVDYLTKPINIDELRARIRVHLANARSAQHARVALDAAGRHLMAVTADGELKWATPQASRLLNLASGSEAGQVAITQEIARWLGARSSAGFSIDAPLAIGLGDRASLHLNYLGEVGANEILFRITSANKEADDEILKRQFGLTGREAEVLVWISKGKANRDIGEILGLSSRTVNKHLEQIYVKLGVENRASAAVKAAAVLHEG
ncbi:response regulator transcription factor [Rhizobium sp. C1]|uniref:response regulator transcription factor n=1 Tax=Rhizobium sp. C1 TaxID=1349799 RepID=UPI001E2E55D8|nr:DNA-binding response regulator [Rhizobium sp. C1]MCD2176255.1 DNA-binding response regulator [Rhizobium sp. C1]